MLSLQPRQSGLGIDLFCHESTAHFLIFICLSVEGLRTGLSQLPARQPFVFGFTLVKHAVWHELLELGFPQLAFAVFQRPAGLRPSYLKA